MNGLWRCAKYAFSPNKLKYCGPDKNQELAGYLKTKTSDLGLEKILAEFAAMWPYLKLIAKENGITDPFDEKVVEAYWLGNALLETVSLKSFFNHARPRLAKKDLKWFEIKLPQGAKPNHQFHVFNFWKRTGHLARLHTLETMDNCRISAGRIILPQQLRRAQSFATPLDVSSGGSPDILRATFAVGRNLLVVKTDKLIYKNGRLELEPTIKEVQSLEGGYKPGDLVTIHWNCVCEKVTVQQAKNLEKYTRLALRLANLTV
ncbi:DUF6390 family protein [Microgenomates group bacterium]|nr:DUF6390 family protein [Microgenomates group bacterium]